MKTATALSWSCRAVLGGVLALVCLACSSEHDCSAVGAEPGVSFDLTGILTNRPVDVRVCVESNCVRHRASLDRWSSISVEDQTLTGPTEVAVSVVVGRIGRGEPVLDQTVTVQLHAYQPNGPECPPLVYVAAVEVGADGINQVADGDPSSGP